MQQNSFKQTEIGIIPENWKILKIDDVADVVGGGTPPTKDATNFGDEIPWITPKDLSNYTYRYIQKGERNITKKGLENSSAKLVPKGTVLLTTRAPVGYVAIAENDVTTNQGFRNLIPKNNFYSEYIYYLLKLNTEYLKSHASGTTFRELSGSTLKSLKFIFPPFEEQRTIASIFSSLDDKIELNRQINQTLESMSQAIFKSWFVDFEPVKAKIAALESGEDAEGVTRAAMRAISGKIDDELDKMEGGQPEDYAKLKTTAGLFPAAMQDSELGEVPEGWEVGTIGEEVGVVGGGTPSTKNPEFWEGGEIHWTTPKDLSNLTDKVLLTTDRKITDAGLKKISSGLLPVNTVLMSSRAPVGYLALAKVPVAVNQGYIAMLCDKQLSPEFVIQWCNSVMDEIKQRSSGTTFAEISKKNFKVIQVVVPSEGIQQSYSEMVSVFYDKITEKAIECINLADIRDSLLPKLLSGEVIPKDVFK